MVRSVADSSLSTQALAALAWSPPRGGGALIPATSLGLGARGQRCCACAGVRRLDRPNLRTNLTFPLGCFSQIDKSAFSLQQKKTSISEDLIKSHRFPEHTSGTLLVRDPTTVCVYGKCVCVCVYMVNVLSSKSTSQVSILLDFRNLARNCPAND